MEVVSFLISIGAISYSLMLLGLTNWLMHSIAKIVIEISSPSFATVWNLLASTISITSWVLAPFIVCIFIRGSRLNKVGRLCLLIIGPFFLLTSITGFCCQTIDYSYLCDDEKCVRFKQVISVALTVVHWVFLIVNSTVNTYAVLVYKLSVDSQASQSLVPLEDHQIVEEEAKCSICLEAFVMFQTASKVKRCGHLFHEHCIQHWIFTNNRCPLCRRIV